MPDVQIAASVLFAIAWGSLALFFIGAFAGTLLLERAYRLALAVFVVATVGGFTFSYLAGFSIGRFTAVLPLVITAFAVTQYRDPRLQVAAQVAAIGIYVLLAWILDEQVHFWGIQLELPLCLVAYAAALIFPPGRNPARA
jgi:hypothetical protein